MSEQALDLRRSAQIVRRHKIVVAVFAALGLLAGIGWALHRPPMLSSEHQPRPRDRDSDRGQHLRPPECAESY